MQQEEYLREDFRFSPVCMLLLIARQLRREWIRVKSTWKKMKEESDII